MKSNNSWLLQATDDDLVFKTKFRIKLLNKRFGLTENELLIHVGYSMDVNSVLRWDSTYYGVHKTESRAWHV